MTAAKIAISIAPAQLAAAQAAVREGRAASVSAYVARALERQALQDTLESLIADLIVAHGKPSAKDRAWARSALKSRK